MTCRIAIVIPVLNEALLICPALEALQGYRQAGAKLIVVDGGSNDQTINYAKPLVDEVLSSTSGRAHQMNHGAATVLPDWIVFLHIDTKLPVNAEETLLQIENASSDWGFFPVRLSSSAFTFRVIERFMNARSRFTKVATGDQALFFRSDFFKRIGQFAEMPLMEDVEICKRIHRAYNPTVLSQVVTTSSRRWEQHGIVRTVLLMWKLRFAFWLGVNSRKIARSY